MPVIEYRKSLVKKAIDIDNGVHLTDNEFVHNTHGFRSFFELDYRAQKLPAGDLVDQHVRIAYNLVVECFSFEPHVTMHVLK